MNYLDTSTKFTSRHRRPSVQPSHSLPPQLEPISIVSETFLLESNRTCETVSVVSKKQAKDFYSSLHALENSSLKRFLLHCYLASGNSLVAPDQTLFFGFPFGVCGSCYSEGNNGKWKRATSASSSKCLSDVCAIQTMVDPCERRRAFVARMNCPDSRSISTRNSPASKK
jgi:hypothetical protein